MPRITNRLTFLPVPVTPGVAHPGSQEFDLALELFIRDRKLINARPQTIRWYMQHLRYFSSYLSCYKLPTAPAEVTLDMVEDFILHQRDERANKSESINGKIRVLKAFFGFLEKKGIMEENPLKNLRQVRNTRHIVPTFTEDQILDGFSPGLMK
ncbi:MAG: tyrosine-type recombinase/integrase [Bacillota bacterium]